jgi:PAS domain S-box-containing protein
VVDSATDGIVTVDAEGILQYVNRSAEVVFGYASADLVGRHVSVVLGETGKAHDAMNVIERSVQQGGAVEMRGRRRDGAVIDLEFSASRWHGQGRSYVTAILRDVTERKASERLLVQLNSSLEHLVAERTADRDRMWRLSSDLMVIARMDGVIVATNPAASDILGWSESRMTGAAISGLVAEEDVGLWDAEGAEIRETLTPRRFSTRVRTSDHKGRWIDWSAVIADGFLQVVGRDVTAEKEAEAALRTTEEALRQSQKMEAIGQLTGGIAHDFNNLLAGVIGGLEIVKRRIRSGRYEDLERFMDASIGSAHRAAALTHRLLAFSRQQPLDPRPHDVNEIITGMRDLLARSLGEQIRLRFRLASDVGLAATDANQLENAILNLVINARDAMPEGGEVAIATTLATADDLHRLAGEGLDADAYVKVSVSDTGMGMPPDVVAKAFDPFFTTKPIGKGTGLGLSMIYGFAKQSYGHAEISSEPGQGTTVQLFLPQTLDAARVDDMIVRGETPLGKGESVLVVEDEASVRMLISDVLHELGYSAVEATDGRGALPILQSDARIDLMVTDVGLPGIDGRKLAEMARQTRPELKILFVTGYAQHAKVREEFLSEGMDMLTKPFALDDLAQKIRQMLV